MHFFIPLVSSGPLGQGDGKKNSRILVILSSVFFWSASGPFQVLFEFSLAVTWGKKIVLVVFFSASPACPTVCTSRWLGVFLLHVLRLLSATRPRTMHCLSCAPTEKWPSSQSMVMCGSSHRLWRSAMNLCKDAASAANPPFYVNIFAF